MQEYKCDWEREVRREKALRRKAGVHPWAKMGACLRTAGRRFVLNKLTLSAWHSPLNVKQLIFWRLLCVSEVHLLQCVCTCVCGGGYINGSSAVVIKGWRHEGSKSHCKHDAVCLYSLMRLWGSLFFGEMLRTCKSNCLVSSCRRAMKLLASSKLVPLQKCDRNTIVDKGHWGRWTLRWMWTLASLSFFSSLIQPSAEGSLSSLPPPTYVPAQGFKVFYWKNGHRRWENMRPRTDLSWNRTQNLLLSLLSFNLLLFYPDTDLCSLWIFVSRSSSNTALYLHRAMLYFNCKAASVGTVMG